MKRISEKDLEAVIKRINIILKAPLEPYVKTGSKFKAQIGNYHLAIEGGGFHLQKMSCKNGSVSRILYGATKTELYNNIQSFISGLYEGGLR